MAMDKENALTLVLIQLILLLIAIVIIVIVAFIFGLLSDVDKIRDGLHYAVLLACAMLIAGAIYFRKN
jgi:hypothetical protein